MKLYGLYDFVLHEKEGKFEFSFCLDRRKTCGKYISEQAN